jgi:hypothetical protein
MFRQGFGAAGLTAYLLISGSPANVTKPVDPATLTFSAFKWRSSGIKGIAWTVILMFCAVFMITATWSVLVLHIRYDPSDWGQTVCIALGSKLQPPHGSCTGHLGLDWWKRRPWMGPKEFGNFDLCYGVESKDHLAFIAQPAPAEADEFYGQQQGDEQRDVDQVDNEMS